MTCLLVFGDLPLLSKLKLPVLIDQNENVVQFLVIFSWHKGEQLQRKYNLLQPEVNKVKLHHSLLSWKSDWTREENFLLIFSKSRCVNVLPPRSDMMVLYVMLLSVR